MQRPKDATKKDLMFNRYKKRKMHRTKSATKKEATFIRCNEDRTKDKRCNEDRFKAQKMQRRTKQQRKCNAQKMQKKDTMQQRKMQCTKRTPHCEASLHPQYAMFCLMTVNKHFSE